MLRFWTSKQRKSFQTEEALATKMKNQSHVGCTRRLFMPREVASDWYGRAARTRHSEDGMDQMRKSSPTLRSLRMFPPVWRNLSNRRPPLGWRKLENRSKSTR